MEAVSNYINKKFKDPFKLVTFIESGVSPWPVVETTKMTACSCGNKLCTNIE